MDNGTIRPAGARIRKFPGYTTDELKIAVMDVLLGLRSEYSAPISAETVEAMKGEVAARMAEGNKVFKFYA